jgi:hypothetical protein
MSRLSIHRDYAIYSSFRRVGLHRFMERRVLISSLGMGGISWLLKTKTLLRTQKLRQLASSLGLTIVKCNDYTLC